MSQLNVPLEKLLEASEGSIYKATILAAKRAMVLSEDGRPLLDKPGEKALDNALREIDEGKIRVKAAKKKTTVKS